MELNLPDEVYLARGKYASLNNELRECRKKLQEIATSLQTGIGIALKHATSDSPSSATFKLLDMRTELEQMEMLVSECSTLVAVKETLREIAYPKQSN